MPKLTRKQRLTRTIITLIVTVALFIVVTSLWYVEGKGYCIGSMASCYA